MNQALAARLREAAEFLEADIPPGTEVIQELEGDVRLDQLDLYCVNLMRVAAESFSIVETENS